MLPQDLDVGRLARALGLLRLPRMPDLRKPKGMDTFVASSIDPESVRFKDKAREKQRQQVRDYALRMATEAAYSDIMQMTGVRLHTHPPGCAKPDLCKSRQASLPDLGTLPSIMQKLKQRAMQAESQASEKAVRRKAHAQVCIT